MIEVQSRTSCEDLIKEKDKEIERLKKREQECIDHYLVQCKYASEMEDKYITANNIINEIEKWCLSWKENDKYCYLASNDKDKCRYDIWEEVLDKLEELKGRE